MQGFNSIWPEALLQCRISPVVGFISRFSFSSPSPLPCPKKTLRRFGWTLGEGWFCRMGKREGGREMPKMRIKSSSFLLVDHSFSVLRACVLYLNCRRQRGTESESESSAVLSFFFLFGGANNSLLGLGAVNSPVCAREETKK